MRVCKNCGQQIENDSAYCPTCGTVDSSAYRSERKSTKYNTLAIVSLCCGIVAFFVNFLGLIAITAVITGVLAKKQLWESEESGSGMATAGIVLGAIEITISILSIIIF